MVPFDVVIMRLFPCHYYCSLSFIGGNFLRYLCSLFSNSTNGGIGLPMSEKYTFPLSQGPLPVPSRSDLPLPLFTSPPPLLPSSPQPAQTSKTLPEEEDASKSCSDNACPGAVYCSSLDSRYQLAKRFLDSLLLQKAAFQQGPKRANE